MSRSKSSVVLARHLIPGGPRPPRSCLDLVHSATDDTTFEAMRRRAWREHGVAALAVTDITNAWLRQAIITEATRRWGARVGARHHDK